VDAGAESAVYDGVVYTPCLGGPSRGAVLDARLLVLDTRRARLEETVRRNRARNSHHRSVSPGPDLSVWRPWTGSLLEAKVVGCWCCCLSEARCRQLCDLHINSMTYTLFFIPDYQFQKVFFMFSWVIIFFTVFGGPFTCGGPWATASVAESVKQRTGVCPSHISVNQSIY